MPSAFCRGWILVFHRRALYVAQPSAMEGPAPFPRVGRLVVPMPTRTVAVAPFTATTVPSARAFITRTMAWAPLAVSLWRRGRAESSARPHGVNIGPKQVTRQLPAGTAATMSSCVVVQPRALHRGLASVDARRRRMPGDDHGRILSSGGELCRDQVISRLVGELCAAAATGEPGRTPVYKPQ